jgi:hypothetical protein
VCDQLIGATPFLHAVIPFCGCEGTDEILRSPLSAWREGFVIIAVIENGSARASEDEASLRFCELFVFDISVEFDRSNLDTVIPKSPIRGKCQKAEIKLSV